MKKDIMLNKNKLKGRDVYIDRDMTWHQREIRRKMKERAKAEKEQGKKAVVKGDILIVNSTRKLKKEDWTDIKKFEIVCLTETWNKKKDRQFIENRMPEYICYFRDAIKVGKKGRANGGMLLAIKLSYKTGGDSAEEQEEIISREVKIDKEKWKIIGTYMNKEKDRNW
ncbi:hypothetical protein QAD02_013747 [Eretmocerus hayati]|uniref:Uncharacterized protein n=1 Tax=Eretmocerus hayati TaxID=131215 RepID=A0ACC2P3J4_9HYME|nr:hypothetical protein QAD02_013747 [Eretmocerus hayati]